MGRAIRPSDNFDIHDFFVIATRGHFSDPIQAAMCSDYKEEDKLSRVVHLVDIQDKHHHFSFTTTRTPMATPFSSPCGMAFDPKDLNKVYHLIIDTSEQANGTVVIDGKKIPARIEKAIDNHSH